MSSFIQNYGYVRSEDPLILNISRARNTRISPCSGCQSHFSLISSVADCKSHRLLLYLLCTELACRSSVPNTPCTISRARLIASGVEIHDFFMITFHPNHSLSFFLTKCQPVAYYIMVCLWTCICKEQDRYGFERIR